MATFDIGKPDPSLGILGAGLTPFRNTGTVRDAAAFRRRIEDFKRHVEQKRHLLFKRILGELLTRVVRANPVGEPSRWKKPRKGYVGGHSRRNWQAEFGNPAAVIELPGAGAPAAKAITEGTAKIARLPLKAQKAWLVNPVDYMEQLNRGWSRQAPPGWIDRILQDVLAKYRRVK